MFTKEEAKEIVRKIVERFEYHLDEYKKGNYNETQTRNDFINPFFEALGWDINNKQGLAESYREVIHEDKIKIGGHTKAPDYCFTIYGQRKFFVEAKKPSVSIKENTDPAYQLRRYGWSAKMPISIITDFEELSIYDCTIKPTPQDKASVARINYLTYKDYLKEFDFLWDTFSKEMVLKGSFDKFVSSNKGKKGTADVDAEFLKSLDSWRDLLARNIVNRNKEIDEDTLNFSLQKIIDRLIFLRICEDRGIESEETLFKTIGSNIYEKLKTIFHIADQKYNSGLFDYRKDSITDSLSIDDIVLKTIIEEMYYPKCPYEFSVIPVEILGHSYEQYLGKVIRITPGHIIKIETKPEVRKAGGVYYTPQYIVDYIVKNTVGKIVEEKTPEEIAVIRICDPACGSGSFLLGAYQFLLDWHRDYYKNNDIKKKEKFLTPDGNLTTAIKKQILLNNIFGVDIDTNAVEVTKLSLMLKAMEGESNASINEQMQLFHERVLPTLDNNIKSGNSLIDMDFYDSQIDFEPGVEKKIKPFNWESAFPQVFKEKIIGENKEIFHITWVTYNSRVSQRMTEYKNVIIKRRINKGLQPLVDKRELTVEEEIEITKYLKSIIEEDNLNVIEFNICKDHIHILLA
nr:N-6 DNA methylase [Candidatus Kapabacteria bacterium]